MTHRTYGVAVVGRAFMGRAHSNAWRNVAAFYPDGPRVRQHVLVGRDRTSLEASAEALGWQSVSTDYEAVLADPAVDVVDLCVPGHLHSSMAIAALEAGKHVLVEKPLANTVAEAQAMADAATAATERGVRAMVGFNYRRVPALAWARQLVADGRIGTVRQARVAYLQDWLVDDTAPMTWRLRKESAGSGALGDLASHAVDQVRALLGQEVLGVNGTVHTFVPRREGADGVEEVTVDDAAWATLQLDGGAVASLEVSRMATGRKNGLVIELYGSHGGLRFDLEALNELEVCLDGAASYSRTLVTEPEHPYLEAWWPPGHVLGWDHTFTSQAADFLRCLAEGRAPEPSFEDGLAVQQVLAAIERSAAASGATVDPKETR
ncbi:Gfo/Idh/MocA family oxidoreductase [Nocardioides aestuarii]|uniref:Gfo/Idh/MocA family protein n=1 Tax=Nocardioides aestuarii TaxID=252231 RepID=A0ABW4TKL9_9ACTN